MARRDDLIRRIKQGLSEFGEGFKRDYEIGKEDTTMNYYRQRDLEDATPEAPKFDMMINTHPGITRTREALGGVIPAVDLGPAAKQALRENDMELSGSPMTQAGQFVGSAANDLTQDRSRSIYWLLNALQATGEVINEKALAKAVPELYSASPVTRKVNVIKGGKRAIEDRPININDEASRDYALDAGMLKEIDGKRKPARGYRIKDDGDARILTKRNYSPGMVQALAIPTGIAINSGLGLLTPFGGAEGYKAAIPDEDDPTKSANVALEIAAKYIMGRTGNLLPYDEFVKVRPDVSPEEYGRYQAFKYDNSEDYNPTDGDISVLMGALKGTTEGIHGPELQMLGRSLPITTGVVPYSVALAGGVAGALRGQREKKAAIGGLIGGTGSLVLGQIAGNVIENERRRRNTVENELNQTVYTRDN
ncbi:MAG: hypothetical protein CML73_02320 [Rhodobiaceae bacterium]|nr:hypothetical protein [Rhodobiaceae bacterium]